MKPIEPLKPLDPAELTTRLLALGEDIPPGVTARAKAEAELKVRNAINLERLAEATERIANGLTFQRVAGGGRSAPREAGRDSNPRPPDHESGDPAD